MTDELLPALPESELWTYGGEARPMKPAYTEDQMRAYAREAIRLSHTWPTLRDDEAMTHPHLEGLMPCPFCGGPADFKHDTVSRTCWVACSRMDCAGEWCNEKDAAEFWNTRALAALPGGGVDWPAEFVKRMREASENVKVPKMSPMKQEVFKGGCRAMIHALNEALTPTPSPHEADRNGRGNE